MSKIPGIRVRHNGVLNPYGRRLKRYLVYGNVKNRYSVEQIRNGNGHFGEVCKLTNNITDRVYAGKYIENRIDDKPNTMNIKHEIGVLMLCKGVENIVQMDSVFATTTHTVLLMEYAAHGELHSYIDDHIHLSEANARLCMIQVIRALHFLHKHQIAHMDIKPANILITEDTFERGVKLCDFGLARVLSSEIDMCDLIGTYDYMAPEVYKCEGDLTVSVDIWSLGVLAYMLLTGLTPFAPVPDGDMITNFDLSFPEELFSDISADGIDFMKRTMTIDPNERPTIVECFKHAWMKDLMTETDIIQIENTEVKDITICDSTDDEDDEDDDDDMDTDDYNNEVYDDLELEDMFEEEVDNGSDEDLEDVFEEAFDEVDVIDNDDEPDTTTPEATTPDAAMRHTTTTNTAMSDEEMADVAIPDSTTADAIAIDPIAIHPIAMDPIPIDPLARFPNVAINAGEISRKRRYSYA